MGVVLEDKRFFCEGWCCSEKFTNWIAQIEIKTGRIF